MIKLTAIILGVAAVTLFAEAQSTDRKAGSPEAVEERERGLGEPSSQAKAKPKRSASSASELRRGEKPSDARTLPGDMYEPRNLDPETLPGDMYDSMKPDQKKLPGDMYDGKKPDPSKLPGDMYQKPEPQR